MTLDKASEALDKRSEGSLWARPPTTALEHSAREKAGIDALAAALQIIPQRFQWEDVQRDGRLLTVQLPWARVALARTPENALRAAQDVELLGIILEYIFESLTVIFPRPVPDTGWAPAYDLAAQYLTASDRKFFEWALTKKEMGLRMGSQLLIVGKWQVWPLAVLLVRLDGPEPLYQLRRRSIEDYELDPDGSKKKG